MFGSRLLRKTCDAVKVKDSLTLNMLCEGDINRAGENER